MAVTFANQHILFRASRTFLYSEITMDSSYTTSGETINASDFGLKEILAIFPAAAKGYTVEAVKSTDAVFLMKVYSFSTNTNTVGAEMVSAKDLSAVVIPVLVVGR